MAAAAAAAATADAPCCVRAASAFTVWAAVPAQEGKTPLDRAKDSATRAALRYAAAATVRADTDTAVVARVAAAERMHKIEARAAFALAQCAALTRPLSHTRQQHSMSACKQLYEAAQSGDVAAARAALDRGADKERRDAEVCCGCSAPGVPPYASLCATRAARRVK
jgi:hypothetical protein